jgi:23S rRNA pseudouridine1911/1915/1917 synthase
MKNKIIVPEEITKERLDKFLTTELDISRSQIQKMIKAGLVLVNDKEPTKHHFIKTNDQITIKGELEKAEESKIKPLDPQKVAENGLLNQIKVVAEHDDYIIIEKPPRLLVHPTDKIENNTLIDWLLVNYPEMRQLGDDPQRPALVHRLDKDVSGLMLIPRNQDSFDYFKKLFKLRDLTKKYTAIVHGEIEKDNDELTFAIGRSKTKPGLFAARPTVNKEYYKKNRSAITRFNVSQRFKNYTLLEIEILTGRTHQIRVHMLAYGHPIVGDNLYSLKGMKKVITNRILLHAHYLSFIAPDGTEQTFISELPDKFNTVMSGLVIIDKQK